MRALLDTHAYLWWMTDSKRLPATTYRVIADEANEIFVSAASAWEITTKHRLGKLPEAQELTLDIDSTIARQGFGELAITVSAAALAGALPGPLRDPFDRMLIAQAHSHGLLLISNELLFDRYGVRRLW